MKPYIGGIYAERTKPLCPLLKKSVASKNRKHSENLKSITSEQDKSVVAIWRFFCYPETTNSGKNNGRKRIIPS